MSLGSLNYDIWCEVLTCLRHDLYFSDKNKFRECRATILHVALTSKCLKDPALSALWRDVDSLEPILRVVNSSAPSEGGAFLYCQTYFRQSRWVLREPPNYSVVASRVRDYLRRIRTLRLNGYPERETTLWGILSQLLRSRLPLLPNLQRLVIASSSNEKFPQDDLMLLLPRSLELLEISEDGGLAPGYEPILEFYKILIFHRVKLKAVTHRGAVSSEILPILCHSNGLESLSIEHKHKVTTSEKSVTILELLQRLPSLTNISIDLGAVSLPTSLSSIPIDEFSLRSLALRTTAEQLKTFFQVGLRYLHVRSLNLYLHSTTDFCWEVILKNIGLSFPTLEALQINITDATNCPPLQMQYIPVFLPRSMTCLQLHNVPYYVTEMMNSWPDITSVMLSGSGATFNTDVAVALQIADIHDFHIRIDAAVCCINRTLSNLT